MTFYELKEASESEGATSSLLRDVLRELADKHHCPNANGFEGPNIS